MRFAHKKYRTVTWTIALLAVLIAMAVSASSVMKLNFNFDLTRGKNGFQLRVHEPDELGSRGKRSGEKKSITADSFEEDANDSNKDSGNKDDDSPSKHVLRSKSVESSEDADENRGVTHALDAREYEPKEPERTQDKEDEEDNNSNESNNNKSD